MSVIEKTKPIKQLLLECLSKIFKVIIVSTQYTITPAVCTKPRKANHLRMPMVMRRMKAFKATGLWIWGQLKLHWSIQNISCTFNESMFDLLHMTLIYEGSLFCPQKAAILAHTKLDNSENLLKVGKKLCLAFPKCWHILQNWGFNHLDISYL